MKCTVHPDVEATSVCTSCDRGACGLCRLALRRSRRTRRLCRACARALLLQNLAAALWAILGALLVHQFAPSFSFALPSLRPFPVELRVVLAFALTVGVLALLRGMASAWMLLRIRLDERQTTT
jgi:hypothetical protein